MNNQRPLGPKDEHAELDYDTSFTGVNERLPAMQLPPGYVASAQNCRFRNGKIEQRLGVIICPWMKGSDGRTPWTEVYGGAVFSDPNGAEWFLIAADGGVWRTQPSTTARPVPLPPGVVLSASSFTKFVQCFNVMVMLRGSSLPPLVCSNLDQGFQNIVLSDADKQAGLSEIPNASFGISYLNRLLLIEGRDQCAVSDVQKYSAYIPVTETFRINQGETDALVAMASFGPGQIVMLKDQSVLMVTNATGDLTGATLQELTREYGCAAALSVVTYGSTLYWMSGEGVTSLQLTQLNQTQTTDVRLSEPMPKTMARINGQYLSGCVGEVWDSKLYMAVPLDDAECEQGNLTGGLAWGFSFNPVVVSGLTIGKKYRLVVNGDTRFDHLVNGGNTYTTDGDFTAVDSTASFYTTVSGAANMTCELLPILSGVNSGVMVYDFQQGAWCGTDEGPVFNVKNFLKAKYLGKKRLFLLGADGVLRLYEEGFEDEILQQVPTPYIDVLVKSLPNPGDTFTAGIGGQDQLFGTVVHAFNSATNAGATWGCDNLTDAIANLYIGYANAIQFGWDCLQQQFSQIDGGVRFTLNAGNPGIDVKVTGNWAFVDRHTGVEITSIPIAQNAITRGYVTRSYIFANEDKKRFLMLAAMIASWAPSYNLTAIVNGVNQQTEVVTAQTRDNTAYEVHGQAAWDPSNVNDDHATPKRQDYSVALPDTGFNLGNNGVQFENLQQATDRTPIDEKGHYVQLQISNNSGRLEVWSVFMEAQEGEKLTGAVV